MKGDVLTLIILVIIVGVITLGLIGWQTGFVVKENGEESKSGLKLINQNTESFQDVSGEQDNSPVFTSDVIRISSSRSSSGGGGSGGGSSGGGSGGNNGGDNPPDITQKPIVEVSINPSTLAKNKNDEFTINVKISTQEKIYAAEFVLSYNSSILKAIEVKKGDFLSKDGKETYEIIRNENGKIIFASTRLGQVEGVSGEGNLAEIKFKAINIGKSQLILDNIKIVDTSLEVDKFKVDIKNSEVTIS